MSQIESIIWIPVEDGYPDDCRPVLVTYKFSDDEYCIAIGEYWGRMAPETKALHPEEMGFGRNHKYVTAWAELPEPYQSGRYQLKGD